MKIRRFALLSIKKLLVYPFLRYALPRTLDIHTPRSGHAASAICPPPIYIPTWPSVATTSPGTASDALTSYHPHLQ